MRHRAAATALLCSTASAGCGEAAGTRLEGPREVVRSSNAAGVEVARLPDQANDVQARASHSDTPRPPRGQLDLRRVALRRDADSMRVTFLTAAPPGPGTIQRLVVYDDQLRSRSVIQVEHPPKGGVRGVVTPPDRVGRGVKAWAAGKRVTVEASLDELTGARRFKWRARTLSGSPVEIDDRAPSTLGDYRIFPR